MKNIAILFLTFFTVSLWSQETAVVFFDRISDYYGTIEDYSCQAEILRGEILQDAQIMYKTPNLLHMVMVDEKGKDVVLNSNNGELQLFLEGLRVTFTQELKRHNNSAIAGMVSSQGLHLLKQNYTIAYLNGPTPQRLDEENPDLVVKLKLNWKTSNEGFREMVLSIGSNNLIRRVDAVTTAHEKIQFDFFDVKINQNIPDSIFEYEAPAIGNSIENFLFEPEE